MNSIATDLQALYDQAEAELKRHDWFSCMSDDDRVHRAGNAHWAQIESLLKQLPVEAARELYLRYKPKAYTIPAYLKIEGVDDPPCGWD